MKTTDLRIGNLVLSKGVPVQIEEIMWETVRYCFGEFPIDYVEPIPLTEEWLLKFGIERRQIKDLISYNTNQLELYQYASNNNKIFFEHADGEVELKYVHQLQNLYFALTGEELTQIENL
jgi:predicted nuclease of predicted toxin-antitoxin system